MHTYMGLSKSIMQRKFINYYIGVLKDKFYEVY